MDFMGLFTKRKPEDLKGNPITPQEPGEVAKEKLIEVLNKANRTDQNKYEARRLIGNVIFDPSRTGGMGLYHVDVMPKFSRKDLEKLGLIVGQHYKHEGISPDNEMFDRLTFPQRVLDEVLGMGPKGQQVS